MPREDRHHRLHGWLQHTGRIGRQRALRELEISESTLKRDIRDLRDLYGIPVSYRPALDAWVLDTEQGGTDRDVPQAIPALWFTAREAHALLTMQQLLAEFDADGVLRAHVGPLRKRLLAMLQARGGSGEEIARRIRVLPMGARGLPVGQFSQVADATLRRRRLSILYYARGSNARSRREVSPQRLVHYRDNWYLDAWCHRSDALKTFSLDTIEQAAVLQSEAITLDDDRLDCDLAGSYGIFGGPAARMARLRFSAESARWVSSERWHPAQRGRFDAQGRWLLDLPYSQPTELVMDILRHVPEVEVLAPEELEAEVLRRLRQGLNRAGELDA